MASSVELTDEYLADLLVRDSQAASRVKQRPRSVATPNTRFLNNLIRETTNHNTALLERDRARARKKSKGQPAGSADRPPRTHKPERAGRWTDVLGRKSDAPRSSRGEDRRDRHKHRGDHDSRPIREHNHARRSRSPKSCITRPKSADRSSIRQRSPILAPRSRIEDDSDPLEELVGPLPAGRVRGRGTLGGGMDARFADPSYDPRADIGQDDHETDDDWANALPTHKARSRTIDADRFLAAGFTNEEVERFLATSKTDDVETVVWKKQGQAREWDRNKAVDNASP